MKYDIQFTNQFKKDLKLAKKQNKNLDKLFEVIDILANGGTLDAKYRDHDLTGNYKGTRECHIEPDWLLIYEIQNNVLVHTFFRSFGCYATFSHGRRKMVSVLSD